MQKIVAKGTALVSSRHILQEPDHYTIVPSFGSTDLVVVIALCTDNNEAQIPSNEIVNGES
jgi:hypothetical protein